MSDYLPEITQNTLPHVNNIINKFNLPRNVIASDEAINYAWLNLPRELQTIPFELRNELIVRMCIATSVGLFDGAINYIWNATIMALRNKIRNFGFGLVSQTLDKKFEEKDLSELMDASLLDLCHKLELLSEEGFFFLDQCRDIRNNFSAAHPSISDIDDKELTVFISRCCKYGLTNDYQLTGIDIPTFISAIKEKKWEPIQLQEWKLSLINTFSAQRQLLIPMLHGMYCDASTNEETRINCLSLCLEVKQLFDEKIKSDIIGQYNTYKLKGQNEKAIASRTFFEKLDLLQLLSESEKHSIIKNACDKLLNAHWGWDNFYSEVPFAERLYELTDQINVPSSTQVEFVITILICYAGNMYGTSDGASYYYEKMIKNFSPKEIEIMLNISKYLHPTSNIFCCSRCKEKYLDAIDLIDENSVATQIKSLYLSQKRKNNT